MGRGRRLLVTGAGGQLGRALGRLEPEAVLLDRRALDVTEASAVARAVRQARPEFVIHAAAYTKVDAAEADPSEATLVNVEGARNVAAAVEEVGALVVYPSTDYVFNGALDRPYREDDPPAPLSIYGKTKLEGEIVVSLSEKNLVVRTSWVFGEGDNFVRTILAVAERREELAVVADQRGRPTFALDLAAGILELVESGASGLFHLAGGGEPATWADLAEATLSLADLKTKVRRVTTEEYYAGREYPVAPRPKNSVLDCSKAEAVGVTLRPWRRALADYLGGDR